MRVGRECPGLVERRQSAFGKRMVISRRSRWDAAFPKNDLNCENDRVGQDSRLAISTLDRRRREALRKTDVQ